GQQGSERGSAERNRQELGVPGAARRGVATHERDRANGALPEAARRRGVDRRGELGIASRLADAPERDVWRERSLLRRKAGVGQTAFHARGETGKRLAPAAHARPHHARPRQRRKRAQALDDELERRGAASGVAQRRTGGVEPIWLDAAESNRGDADGAATTGVRGGSVLGMALTAARTGGAPSPALRTIAACAHGSGSMEIA